jgi:aminoglycoside/choline kinase family phosphotransferase
MSEISKNKKKNINTFLNENNLANCLIKPIPQDASSRKYYRIHNKNLLLMLSNSDENKNYEFIKVSKYLKSIGLSSPEIIKVDHEKGLFLIEDFGDLTFNKAMKNNISEELLYTNAIKCLSTIHNCTKKINVPLYNYKYLINEVNLFPEWYLKEINIKINNQIIQEWQEAWIKILNKLNNNKLVLRDFHADNLFWLPDRSNIRKIGLIDFQDALIGNEAYDISSLLEDVRTNVSKRTKEISIQKFIDLNKINNKKEFMQNYNILTAQRNAKIVGLFIRLTRRDKKFNYLKLVNKAMKIFLESANEAELKDILIWIEKYIPKNKLYL